MISAQDAAARLAALLAREHTCMAGFLEALAEFDRLKGWEELGYRSLFWFLHRRLGLSKAAAYGRKVAAELLTRLPDVLPPLRDGRLCLTSVVELSKVVTSENAAEVLPRFFHCSRREAAEVRAALVPVERPPTRNVVTTPARARAEAPAPNQGAAALLAPSSVNRDISVTVHPGEPLLGVMSPAPAPQHIPPPRPPEVVPLTADLRRLHVTVSKRLLAKLDIARDALSHSHPGASMEAVLEEALDLLIERHRKRRGVGAKARHGTRGAGSRDATGGRITAEVKREVWERDHGSCQWPLDGGGTCGSTLRLEYDHRVPRSLGGGSGADNVRLLCRVHNQLSARRVLGEEVMARFVRREPAAREPAASYGAASYGAASCGAAWYGAAWYGPAG